LHVVSVGRCAVRRYPRGASRAGAITTVGAKTPVAVVEHSRALLRSGVVEWHMNEAYPSAR
jgi:hypothetical protein